MRTSVRPGWALVLLGLIARPAAAQEGGPAPAKAAASAAPAGTAATVNGQSIPEVAVQRSIKRRPPEERAEARAEVLDYLIDNALIDQYLVQRHVEVPQAELDARVGEIREEIKKGGQTVEKVMQELMLTEDELRAQLAADLRWEKFVSTQATEKVLRELFDKNPEVFDGTTVRARHILVAPSSKDPQAAEQAKAKILELKRQIEEAAAQAVAKLPAGADEAAREKARAQAIEDAFAAAAHKESACPSKEIGGDLGWFARARNMAEPFAAAAFALKPYQMSDVVVTRFGYHLILATGRRPGKDTKFDDVKDVVRDFFGDRLRDYLCGKLKPGAKIVINAVPGS